MNFSNTDIREIAALHAAGSLTAAQAATLTSERTAYLLRTIEDGLKFRAWQAARDAQLA